MIKVLHLGAGVQSTTLLLMSIRGDLPKADHAIFADTGWEPPEVYSHLESLKPLAEQAGISIHTVSNGHIRDDTLSMCEGRVSRAPALPYFLVDQAGKKGMMRRQCTSEYKIRSIERFIRSEILRLRPRQWGPREPVLERWFGISYDEPERMRTSGQKWAVNVYPLIDMEPPMTRDDCLEWLRRFYPELRTPRSACVGCPFHSDSEWRRIKDDPALWADAVDFDRRIRTGGPIRARKFLHASRVPLEEVDLADRGPGWGNECAGICGV